jgi:hypothetical protein
MRLSYLRATLGVYKEAGTQSLAVTHNAQLHWKLLQFAAGCCANRPHRHAGEHVC